VIYKEALALLIIAGKAAGHRTNPDHERVETWAAVLATVTFDDAKSALMEHLMDPDVGAQFLMPAHITRILEHRRRDTRLALALKPQLPEECDIHPHYPLLPFGCDQCKRHPEDRTLGIVPPRKAIGDLLSTYEFPTEPMRDTQ
jgi:hypothetical protein